MQENIGFWKGIGLAWTSMVMTVVMALRACETTASAALHIAQSGEEATKVMKANVISWAQQDEQLKKLNALTT